MTIYLRIFAFALVSALALASCKKQETAAVNGNETELFAKAQDLQKQEKFEDAVRTYREIARNFPTTKQGANSQFMVGYIYANHIKDYEQAKIELNRFIDKYSSSADSGLVAGAKFELQYLGKSIDEIPILSNLEASPPDTGK